MPSDHYQMRSAVPGPARPVQTGRLSAPARRMVVALVIVLGACLCPVAAAQAALPGVISTVAGNGNRGYQGNGVPAISGELNNPDAVAAMPDGGLLIANAPGNVVRFVAGTDCSMHCPFGLPATTDGDIYTIAGDGAAGHSGDFGLATHAELDFPRAVAIDRDGDVLIADALNHQIRLVARSSCASDCPYGLASTRGGYIYTVAGSGVPGAGGNHGPAGRAQLRFPDRIAVDNYDDLLITDKLDSRVLLLAGLNCTNDCPYGLPSLTKGYIYVVAGNGHDGYSGDAGPATNAELHGPTGLAFDSVGDLLIADSLNNRVRLVATSSCSFDCQYGLRSTIPGDIYTVAGNGSSGFNGDGRPANLASLSRPDGVAVDGVGDLVIDDAGNDRIRVVPDIGCSIRCAYGDPMHWEGKGFIYTLAGSGTLGYSGDGGQATVAELNLPLGVAVDGNGNLLVADTLNQRIRMVTAADQGPVCYETGAREVGQNDFTGTDNQEDVVVYAPAGLMSITNVTVVNGTAEYAPFTPGTKSPVIVTATATSQNTPVSGYYKATDEEGRSTLCGFYIQAS